VFASSARTELTPFFEVGGEACIAVLALVPLPICNCQPFLAVAFSGSLLPVPLNSRSWHKSRGLTTFYVFSPLFDTYSLPENYVGAGLIQ